jgi:hypothetical protein
MGEGRWRKGFSASKQPFCKIIYARKLYMKKDGMVTHKMKEEKK